MDPMTMCHRQGPRKKDASFKSGFGDVQMRAATLPGTERAGADTKKRM
jgi:hypothetical protein